MDVCEDPYFVHVSALLPFTYSLHLLDVGVQVCRHHQVQGRQTVPFGRMGRAGGEALIHPASHADFLCSFLLHKPLKFALSFRCLFSLSRMSSAAHTPRSLTSSATLALRVVRETTMPSMGPMMTMNITAPSALVTTVLAMAR